MKITQTRVKQYNTTYKTVVFEIEKVITKETVENELYDFFNDKMKTGDAPEIERVKWFEGILVTSDNGIVVDCLNGKQIRLIIQVD